MPELSYDEEILDLVDSNDKVVGAITHEAAFDFKNLKGNNLRASNAYIMNDEGKLWVPRRTAHKRIKPNALDYSAAEHVMSGETYEAAMVRGFEEELNIQVTPEQLIYLGTAAPQPENIPYFEAYYLLISNEAPKYNPEDFVSYEWLTPDELKGRIASGDDAKEYLGRLADLILDYRAKHISKQ